GGGGGEVGGGGVVWWGETPAALGGRVLMGGGLGPRHSAQPSVTATIPALIRLTVVVVALVTPFQSHFTLGQMDLITLCLCCLFCHADIAGRRTEASMWLGGAIAMKLTPLVFVPSLIRRRQYRLLILTVPLILLSRLVLPAPPSDPALSSST